MPTYEYRRSDGTVFEQYQEINEDKLRFCPLTGLPVKRLISRNPNVIFYGGGWDIKDQQLNKRKKKMREERMYTSLPEYKDKVEAFKDKNKIATHTDGKIVSYNK